MANLDVTQAPVPVSVDTPNIITSLDTNTGPQASPAMFGPDLNGLAQNLDAASQNIQQTIYRNRYEQREQQQAQGEVWALGQYTDLAKTWMQKSSDAVAAGKPLDLEQINSQFQSQLDQIASNAPNDYARTSFLSKGSSLGLSLYGQNLNFNKNIQLQDARAKAQGAMNLYVDGASTGAISSQDAIAGLNSIGQAVAPVVPDAPNMVNNGTSQILQSGLERTAQTQGYGAAAAQARSGYGGTAIPDVPRETLATQFDNMAAITQEARRASTDQTLGNLMQQAATTGAVPMVDQHAAVTAQAEAHTALPLNQDAAPDLVSVVEGAQEKYGALENQVSGRFPEIQLEGYKRLAAMESSKLIEQRLNVMPIDQQQLQLAQIKDAFGGLAQDDPLTGLLRHATTLVTENTNLLSQTTPDGQKNPAYDPVTIAYRNTPIQTSMANALQALQAAQGNPQAIGAAQGKISNALQLSFAAQRLAGVQSGSELVLSRPQVEQYAGNLNTPADYQKLYGTLTSTYNGVTRADGTSASTIALQQVFEKKGVVPGSIQLAALNPNRQDNWAAASYVNPLPATDPKMKALAQAVDTDPTLQSFGNAQQSDPRWASQHDQWTAGLVQMAAYQMAQHGVTDPKVAVAAAVKNTIAAKYNIIGTDGGNQLAIPTDYAPTTTDAKSLQDKANVALTSLQRDAGATIGQTSVSPDGGPAPSMLNPLNWFKSGNSGGTDADALRWRQVFQQGKWVYDAGSQSLVRYQSNNPNGDAPFLLSDGRPLAFKVAGLKGSNIITNSVPVPLHAQDLGSNPTGEDIAHAQSRTVNVGQRLDTDLNSIIPPAAASSRTYFPLSQPDAPSAAPSAPPMTPNPSAPGVSQAQDWHSGAEMTHYAYRDDNTPDRNSKNGIGAFGNNPLTPGAVALSPSMEKRLNAVPGDVLDLVDDGGNHRFGYFADRTSQKLTNDRIDLYDPHGSEADGVPFKAVSYRNVGGGRKDLAGRRLSAEGERNIALLEGSQ